MGLARWNVKGRAKNKEAKKLEVSSIKPFTGQTRRKNSMKKSCLNDISERVVMLEKLFERVTEIRIAKILSVYK